LNFNEFEFLHLAGEAEFKKKVRKRFGVISSDIMKFQGGGGGLLKCLSRSRLERILLIVFKDAPDRIRDHRWLYCFIARKEHLGMNNYRVLHGLDPVACQKVDHDKVYQLFLEFLRRKGKKVRRGIRIFSEVFDECNATLNLPAYFKEKCTVVDAITRKGYDGYFEFRKTLTDKRDIRLFDNWIKEIVAIKKIPKADVRAYLQGQLNLHIKYRWGHRWTGDAKLLMKLTLIDNKSSYSRTDVFNYPKDLLKNLIEEYDVKGLMPDSIAAYIYGAVEVLPCPSWNSFDEISLDEETSGYKAA
jgi:hypothetical protein